MTKNVITSCSVTMILFRHLDVKPLMFFFFQAEDGIRDGHVTGVQTCALPILEMIKGGDPRDVFALDHFQRWQLWVASDHARDPRDGSRRITFEGLVSRCAKGITLGIFPRPEIGRASCRERV